MEWLFSRNFSRNKKGQYIVPNTYENSEVPLYVGNYEGLGGVYFGEIKEVKISKSLLNDTDDLSSWNKFKQAY